MKNHIIFFFLLFSQLPGFGQTLAPSPAQNFTRKETIYASGKKTDADVLQLTVNNKSTVFEYSDGAGRPIQQVSRQASPLKNDLIQPIVYDTKGRPSTGYLPYRSTATNGGYRTSAVSEQGSFYNSPPTGMTGDTRPRTNTVYEDSPLDRVLKSTNTGSDFDNKFTEVLNLVNNSTDFAVRKWEVVNGLPRSTTTYPNNTLNIVQTKDEQNHLNRKYTDWLGRTVLTQVQSAASVWLSTYYVYNDFGELLFIIPAQASGTLTPDITAVNLWHFQYSYDDFGRQIGSKAPGAGWVYTIYDKWDRPVLTQDGVQRAITTPEWTYVKFDNHNRPVITGTIANGTAIETLRTQVASSPAQRFETRNTTALGYTITSSYPTNAAEPGILSITYYDDYNFRTNTGWSNLNSLYAFQNVTDLLLTSSNTAVKGLVTGSKSRSQGTNVGWVYSITYYDQFYRPVQTVSSHHVGTNSTVRSTSQYAFSGEVEKTRTHYIHTGGPTTIDRRFTYDHAGRALKVYHKVNNEDEVMLSWFQYNELGEPVNIIHHSRNDGGNFMYKNISSSTIQGWLDEIHYRYSDNQTVFREELDYQKLSGSGNATRFDGLVTSQKWKHYGSAPEEAYNYSYDIPKRLTAGTYRHNPSGTWNSSNLYNENGITYSTNGNINTLTRNKNNGGTSAQMDLLAYTYSGNRLTAVTDNAPAAHKADGFNDGNVGSTDYTYNGNGFLISDANKGITSITYTILDRPQRVNFSTDGPNIRYTYGPGGDLMTVTYHSTGTGAATKTLQYVGELVFENGILTDINHELGRVLANNGFKYQYYLTDHLGSTRVVLQEDPGVFTASAGFEMDSMDDESGQFIGYEEVTRISADMFNHTEGEESTYAMRLSGGYGENIGLAKSISVMPGDTVRMEVYGKYIDIGEAKRNPAIMAVLMAITAADPVAMGIDGGMAATMSSQADGKAGLAGLLTSKKEIGDAPPAYLNYLFFDREMNYKYGGFVQMSNKAREDGSNVPHEKLAQEVIAEEPGYFYIYLSNDSNTGSEAFFDDFSIMTSESYIVQQTDYYPYGMIAKNWTRVGEKATKDLFQGKTYEDLTKWYDFHARQYDASLGRWFGVDPQNQFASPYLAMGNNPVMMVDPDGELAWFVPIIIGAVVGGATGGVIAHNNGQDFWGGVLKGALTGAALTATMGKAGVFGANVKSGMAAYAKAKAGTKLANVASNSFSGALNMVNNYDPDAGVGHMLGNFAAGYIGSYAGIEESFSVGAFFTGGALTSINDLLHGRIKNEYGLAQSFVGGGLSALAGKSFNEVLDKPKYWINKDVFAKYGLQNVASNFAYDRRQEFFKKPLAIHGAAFMVGGVGASLQQGIMGGNEMNTPLSTVSRRFGLSMLAYGAEYSANYYFKSKMQYVKYGDYRSNKALSFGIKSLAYSWLFSFN